MFEIKSRCEKLKKLVKKKYNKIVSIKMNTRTLPSWREGDYKSVSAKKKYGSGVINELSHELDLMLY